MNLETIFWMALGAVLVLTSKYVVIPIFRAIANAVRSEELNDTRRGDD